MPFDGEKMLQGHIAKFLNRGLKAWPDLAVLRATFMSAVLVYIAIIDNMADHRQLSGEVRPGRRLRGDGLCGRVDEWE